MRERGAVALIDGRAVLLSADSIDITAEAIARIDAEIGEGQIDGTPPQVEPQGGPDPAPEDAPGSDPDPDTPEGPAREP
jgi:hypothetical protein